MNSRYLNFCRRFGFVALAVLVSLSSALLVAKLVDSISPLPVAYDAHRPLFWRLVSGALLAPVIETVLAVALLQWVEKKSGRPALAFGVTLAAWSGAHGLALPAWAVITLIPLAVYLFTYRWWLAREPRLAVVMSTVVHAVHNGVALLLSYFTSP